MNNNSRIVIICCTGKSFSEALILAIQYDKRLFIELQEKYKIQNMLCTNIVLNVKTKTKQLLCTTCCELVFFGNSMNNLLSYFVLVDARISGSEKDLPVLT